LTNSNSESEDTKYEFDLKEKKRPEALLKLKYFGSIISFIKTESFSFC
jgi:hypothetical protein